MSALLILLIAVVALALGYVFYGSWLSGALTPIARPRLIQRTTERTSFLPTPPS